VQRIDLVPALAVVLEPHPVRQGEEIGEALLQPLVALDLAADVADHPAQSDAQKLQRPAGALELVRVGIAPNHDRGALSHPAIALPQRHIVALCEIDQLLQSPAAQPRVGRMGDRLRLYRRIDHHPFEITARQRPGLVRHRQALLEERDQLRLAQPLAPMRQRRTVERQLVAEAQFAAEELVIRVLQPARAQHLVRQIVHVLQDQQPAHQPGRQRRLTRSGRAHAGKPLVEKPPIDRPRQPHQRMAEIDDLLQRWPQQILLTIVPWLRHRAPQTPMTPEPTESQIAQNRNPKSPENPLQTHRFPQNRLLRPRRYPNPLSRLDILHGGLLSVIPAHGSGLRPARG
jgi:hypothetical protein